MAIGGILSEIYSKYDAQMASLYSTASAGISNYVIPIAWVLLGILLLWWSFSTITGKSTTPIMDWIMPIASFALVLYAMGNGYLLWVADPLFNLPEAIASATGKSGGDPIQVLASFETKFTALISACFQQVADLAMEAAFGAALALILLVLVLLIVGIIMMVVVFCGLLYAKLGLTLVLAVGPFFILALVLNVTRDKFMSWLNTVLFFVFYYVLCILFMALFFALTDGFLQSVAGLTDADMSAPGRFVETIRNSLFGGDKAKTVNVLALFLPMILSMAILALMFMQLSSIAGSMTSGAGGAVGQGAMSMGFYASGVLRKFKGKKA